MLNTDRFSGLATATLVLHVSDDAMVNFTQCEIDFLGNETALELYSYIGPIHDDIPGEPGPPGPWVRGPVACTHGPGGPGSPITGRAGHGG